ncbi:MAG: hypothetical protein QOG09_621 [Solirubrobacterales bacterium]|jgi:hypothetical protein|nr:hypothetical protein [Solirubrobacterales bacterium]
MIALGLAATAAVVAVLAFPRADASSSTATGHRCFADTVRVGGTTTAIRFRVRCFRQTIEQLTVEPDSKLKGFRRHLEIRYRHDPREHMKICVKRLDDGNGFILCRGRVLAGTQLIGRLNVPVKKRCSTGVTFQMVGGLPCSYDGPCRRALVTAAATDRRPSGC